MEASNAIRVICSSDPAALATLVNAISYDPYPRARRMHKLVAWAPDWFSTWVNLKLVPDRGSQRSWTATSALMALGPDAAPVGPELSRLLVGTNWAGSQNASSVILTLGTNALPILLELMSDETGRGHKWALSTFHLLTYEFGTNAPAALPILERDSHSSDTNISSLATEALAHMRTLPPKSKR
jgi:hypothetical protein